jgi:hypothetical protein
VRSDLFHDIILLSAADSIDSPHLTIGQRQEEQMRISQVHYILFLLILLVTLPKAAFCADLSQYSLNIYSAKMTGNNWEEIFTEADKLDFIDSKMIVVALAKRLGPYQPRLNYEIEGQIVKHFSIQNHWEFNALGVLRWESFWWDRFIDTSAAFGLGASYATEIPKAEVIIEGDSKRWMAYWMMEIALSHPQVPNIALITRIHHRSEAFGLIADEGGSNSLAIGLKIIF